MKIGRTYLDLTKGYTALQGTELKFATCHRERSELKFATCHRERYIEMIFMADV